MTKTTIIVITIAIFLALIVGASLIGQGNFVLNENRLKAPAADPIDVSLGVANRWMDNLSATTSLSLADFVSVESVFSQELKMVLGSKEILENDLDPILCQLAVPARVGAKQIYVTDDEAQVMVVARGADKNPNQAIVTMAIQDDAWEVTDITCSAGELGTPKGEYVFEQVGQLIQASIPEPYDPNFWHIVFERDGTSGYAAKLLFDGESICIDTSAQENVCDPDSLAEVTSVFIQADMTEEGAVVRRLELR